MIPTPDLSHLTRQDYEHVYEPAEDTFILLDALEQDADRLRAMNATTCLEVGSGSGCVSSFISNILGPSSVVLDAINANLVSPLRSRLANSIDIILFNPPYVPTYSDEAHDAQEIAGIQGSWAGGRDGMEVTDIFLDQVKAIMSPKGIFYLVAVKDNDIPSIRHRMLERHSIRSDIVLQRRAGREHLFVLRFST